MVQTFQERKERLLQQKQETEARLEKLEQKRVFEIGQLAMQAGLECLSNEMLRTHFELIAKGQYEYC